MPQAEDALDPGRVPESEIRAQLEKILVSQGFAEAGRLGPFLRYVVGRTLAGDTASLKESVLGVEVFQRPADYDPRIDPIVRVEARRLRSRLSDYYEGAGAAEPVRIDLPKGTYVPVFSRRTPAGETAAPTAATSRRRWPIVAATLLVVAGLGAALWRFRSSESPPPSQPRSLAVLPFVNLSEEPANEYFSDGLTEELIDALTKVEGLRVAARGSSFQFKGKARDIREIGRQLNAGAVVEGSVRKSGDRLRITAQLVNAADGYHLWSQTYERELKDIFAIQEEIARSIVNALKLQLRVDLNRVLARRYTDNIEAYNLYLQGRHHWNRYSREGSIRAIEYLEKAAAVDRGYAPAYALQGSVYALIGYYQALPPQEAWPKAKNLALQALEIDDTLAEAHASLGFVLGLHEWNWAASEGEFRRALELNPTSAQVRGTYAICCLMPQGRLKESSEQFKKALELDPLVVFANYTAAFSLLASGEYDRAIEQYRRTLELTSDHPDMWWDLGMAYGYRGLGAQALAAFEQSGKLREPPGRLGPIEYALAGEMAKARAMIDEVDRKARAGRWRAIDMARTHAVLGNRDKAFEWLEEAFQVRDPQLVWLKVDPRFGNLRGDPRHLAMLRRLGLN
jgi:serine/threonine-protein kinase